MGDFYKAYLLCDKQIQQLDQRPKTSFEPLLEAISSTGKFEKDVEQHYSVADSEELEVLRLESLQALMNSMRHGRCYQDCINLANHVKHNTSDHSLVQEMERQAKLSGEGHVKWLKRGRAEVSSKETQIAKCYGFIFRRIYPWMVAKHFKFVIVFIVLRF